MNLHAKDAGKNHEAITCCTVPKYTLGEGIQPTRNRLWTGMIYRFLELRSPLRLDKAEMMQHIRVESVRTGRLINGGVKRSKLWDTENDHRLVYSNLFMIAIFVID